MREIGRPPAPPGGPRKHCERESERVLGLKSLKYGRARGPPGVTTPFQPHTWLVQVLPGHPLADLRSRSSRKYVPESTDIKK